MLTVKLAVEQILLIELAARIVLIYIHFFASHQLRNRFNVSLIDTTFEYFEPNSSFCFLCSLE